MVIRGRYSRHPYRHPRRAVDSQRVRLITSDVAASALAAVVMSSAT
jgi:hypothetical protein